MADSRPGVSCAVIKLCVHYASIEYVIVSNCPFSSIHDLFIVTMESPHFKRCPESCPMHCASCLVMWYGKCVCCGASVYEVAGKEALVAFFFCSHKTSKELLLHCKHRGQGLSLVPSPSLLLAISI